MNRRRVFITGGCGFIGSHFVQRLLADDRTEQVSVFDRADFGDRFQDDRLRVWQWNAKDPQMLIHAMRDHDLVIHLAANGDITAAEQNPAIDFENGTQVMHHVLEAMRKTGVQKILYMSSGSVYGWPNGACYEDDRLKPIAPYAASKVAGEAMLSAYRNMFGIQSWIFRPANVVGRWMVRGVSYDFIRRLRQDPSKLEVKGDGNQTKSYILASDVVSAMLAVFDSSQELDIYNLATGDYMSVKEIVPVVLGALGLEGTPVYYQDSPIGWKGDTPITRLDTSRIRSIGWQPTMNSAEAIHATVSALVEGTRVS